jgi:hypothetical protein
MQSNVSYEITKEDIKHMHLQFLNYKILYIIGILSILVGTFLLGIQVLSFVVRALESGIFDTDIIFWGVIDSIFILAGFEYLLTVYLRYRNYITLKKDYPGLFNVVLTITDDELIYESAEGQNRLAVKKVLVKKIFQSKDFIFIITKASSSTLFILKKYLNNEQINKIKMLKK